MPDTSSSSLAGGRTFAVWLVNQSFQRMARVDVPVPMPALVAYGGLYYTWSDRQFSYTQTDPFVPQADLGAPALSVVSDPQF